MTHKTLIKRVLNVTIGLVVFALVMTFSLEISNALCIQPDEEGEWVNIDPNTRGLTRINLRFVCQDQIRNGEPYPPGPPWYVHIWGKCHPTDCDWGEVGATQLTSGYIYAFYDHGFAKRYVYAKMSAVRPGLLYVYMWTNFTDPGRADYSMHCYFRRR